MKLIFIFLEAFTIYNIVIKTLVMVYFHRTNHITINDNQSSNILVSHTILL